MSQLNGHLSESDREALRLAHDLRERMTQWMSRRGVAGGSVLVSPFVDPSGQPNVLVRMNPHILRAMLRSFDEQRQPQQEPTYQVRRPPAEAPPWPPPPDQPPTSARPLEGAAEPGASRGHPPRRTPVADVAIAQVHEPADSGRRDSPNQIAPGEERIP